VTAVGQVGFPGGSGDEEWHWFEAAVNEVLSNEPLKGVCLYDEASLDGDTIHEACLTHPTVSASDPELVGEYHGPTAHRPPVPPIPDRTPDVFFEDATDVGEVRAAIRTATADCSEDFVDQLLLVVSEMVTNAIRHGGGCKAFAAWVDETTVSIRVVDSGPGISDPYAPLRPPDLGVRGVGLWICAHETSRFHVASSPAGGTVATSILQRPT
jgi:anti-sigma regulatory factor (Ser/Thr protein kinase)